MSRSTMRALLLLVPLALLLGGCLAVGQSFQLAGIVAALVAAGGGSIAVGVLDRREWIRSGAKPPFYAGSLRGGFGNPFDVVVRDRKPLAEVFAQTVADSLKAKGFQTNVVTLDPNTEDSAATQQLTATGAGKTILIGIDQWSADTMTNVGMHYDLTVQVLDPGGNVLASNTITGEEDGKDNLKGSVMNPAGYAKKVVPIAFKEHVEKLLNDDAIVKALA